MPLIVKTASVTIDDNRLSYWEAGEGRPLAMLHGNPGTKDDFLKVADGLVKQGWRCLSFDRPGHGNSEEALGDSPDPWIDADILGQAIKKIAQGPAILVGYSLGSFTALKVALKHPDAVSGLALISPFLQPSSA